MAILPERKTEEIETSKLEAPKLDIALTAMANPTTEEHALI